jgi:competence protein ComEA
VQQPGLYQLPEGANVQDAIEAASGPTENAGLDLINLATILNDGQRITIPPKTDIQPSLEVPQRSSGLQINSLIKINTASQEELESLPGIGEVKARAIIDYRTQNGFFLNLEELMNVEGIGQKTFEQLIELITIDP